MADLKYHSYKWGLITQSLLAIPPDFRVAGAFWKALEDSSVGRARGSCGTLADSGSCSLGSPWNRLSEGPFPSGCAGYVRVQVGGPLNVNVLESCGRRVALESRGPEPTTCRGGTEPTLQF